MGAGVISEAVKTTRIGAFSNGYYFQLAKCLFYLAPARMLRQMDCVVGWKIENAA